MKLLDNHPLRKLGVLANGAVRRSIVSVPWLNKNCVIVNEYPKSGGTWLCNMISDALEIPFPRNSFPSDRKIVVHGHFMKCRSNSNNRVIMWRDGRDVVVSWYYHSLFKNNLFNHALVDRVDRDLAFKDKSDIKSNLPVFIEYCYTKQTSPKFSWSHFAREWVDKPNVVHTSYEKLSENPIIELSQIIRGISDREIENSKVESIVEKHKFVRKVGIDLGKGDPYNFQRKGVVGDWRNCFTDDSAQLFKHFAGEELILLGYEQNNEW